MPRRKRLKRKGRNRTPGMGAKNERAEWEFEGKIPPFFAFFSFSMVLFFFSSAWEDEDVRRKHLKQKGKNGRAEVGAKNERVEQEFEGKFFPFSAFFFPLWFFFLCFFLFSYIENKKMPRESVWNKRTEVGRQKRELKMRRQSTSLKESSFPFLHFFFSPQFFFLCFFLLFFYLKRKRC